MKYRIILADPPWQYRDKCAAGKRGAEYKYRVMSLDRIKKLDVTSIAEDDSVLFLWVTFPQLPVAFEVMKAWKFQYKTIGFVWVKTNPKSGTLFWGMGNATRSNAEICLLGRRGKGVKRLSASVHSVVMSSVRKHSEKPDEVRERIVDLYGDRRAIELFARKRMKGWDCWGDEVRSDIEIPFIE